MSQCKIALSIISGVLLFSYPAGEHDNSTSNQHVRVEFCDADSTQQSTITVIVEPRPNASQALSIKKWSTQRLLTMYTYVRVFGMFYMTVELAVSLNFFANHDLHIKYKGGTSGMNKTFVSTSRGCQGLSNGLTCNVFL